MSCWLQVHYADAAYVQVKAASPAEHAAAVRLQNSAEWRYMHAVKVLTTTQKLRRPALSPVDMLRRTVAEAPTEKVAGGRSRLRVREEGLVLN